MAARDMDRLGDGEADAEGETDDDLAYTFPSSPPQPRTPLSQEVLDFNQAIAEAKEAHRRRHNLHHGITKPSDWGLG
jgi:hypothetical protein